MSRGGWREVLVRTSVGAVSSYAVNSLSGYRELVFIFESLGSSVSAVAVSFEVGITGPTFRTSGYIGFAAAVYTDAIAKASTSAGGNLIATWTIHIWNGSVAGEKTTARSAGFQGGGVAVPICVGRYDTAESHTCFRIRETAAVNFDSGVITVLGKV